MHVGALTLELHLPGCATLKEKRGRLKPLLAGLHRTFNVSAAEIGHLDSHTQAVVACAVVSNQAAQVDRVLAGLPGWIESRFPDIQIIDQHVTPL
jgi:uncharacterized protein